MVPFMGRVVILLVAPSRWKKSSGLRERMDWGLRLR